MMKSIRVKNGIEIKRSRENRKSVRSIQIGSSMSHRSHGVSLTNQIIDLEFGLRKVWEILII